MIEANFGLEQILTDSWFRETKVSVDPAFSVSHTTCSDELTEDVDDTEQTEPCEDKPSAEKTEEDDDEAEEEMEDEYGWLLGCPLEKLGAGRSVPMSIL